jgi:hypothetical protein
MSMILVLLIYNSYETRRCIVEHSDDSVSVRGWQLVCEGGTSSSVTTAYSWDQSVNVLDYLQ